MLLTTRLGVLRRLTNPSALIIPSLEYSVTQTVLVRVGAYVPLGRGPDVAAYQALTATNLATASPAFQSLQASRGLRANTVRAHGAFVQAGLYLP